MSQLQGGLFDRPVEPVNGGEEKILVGTSGYVFRDWQGVFYPAKLTQKQWLGYYASRFRTVEINATYYGLPSRSTFEGMANRTPADFSFWVKVPGAVTHQEEDLRPIMWQFNRAVEPLKEAGKLSGVLAQFPQKFHYAPNSIERIRYLKESCRDVALALEIRHRNWQRDDIYDFFRKQEIITVLADLPKLPDLPEPKPVVTGGVAYLRLHGRNSSTWHHPEHGDRYDYLYSETELEGISMDLRNMAEKAVETYVFFNNCHMGQAVKNAMMLRTLLGQTSEPNL